MSKSAKVRETKLAELESEFQLLLVPCLRQCVKGRWGLFGQNESADPDGRYWSWPEARRLKALAVEIRNLRLEFGQMNQWSERFLESCSVRGSNSPGEPKLAAEFLADLGEDSSANG